MPSFIELVGPVPAPDWGAWEPLALTLVTAGAAALALLCLSRLAGLGKSAARPLSLAALAAGLAGQAALFVSLEQPLRAYEFFLHPSFTSWTAAGAYLVPFFLACAAVAAHRARSAAGLGAGMAVIGLASAAGVFVYATNEIMACVGRGAWTGPMTPPAFLAAGLAAGAGLAALFAARLRSSAVPHSLSAPASALAGLCAFACACCAVAGFALPTPEGFAQSTTGWWRAPEALCLLLALAPLAARAARRSAANLAALAPASGVAGLLSALLLYWKLIHMGQAFARNAATVADKAALLDLLSWPSILATAGAAGLLLALSSLLPALLPERQAS